MNIPSALRLVRNPAFAIASVMAGLPAAAQSEYQGTYVGYAYVRLEGAVTQPETAAGTVIAEVNAAGGITLLDGTTGTVDAGGAITWTQPNDLFLTAGDITDGTLNGSGSTSGNGVTTFTRIELNAGGGFDAADSLDDVFELINPENLLQNGVRVIHDGTQFVTMSSNGTVSVSSDGLAWTSRSIGSLYPIEDFAFGGGTYVAVGEQNTLLTSTDLVTWTPRSSGIGDLQNWTLHTVDFFNGRFYIGNTIGAVARSGDATAAAWEPPVIPGNATSGLGATIKIRSVNGVLIVSGKPLFNPSRVVKYSTDGVTFTDSTISLAFASTAAQIFPATVGGTDYIVINFGSHLAASPNGASFSAFANPQNFGFMAFDGNRFIARTLGSNAQFYHSTDLQTWTLDTNTAFAGVEDAVRSGSTMVAVGTTARVAPNTTDWQVISTSPINRPAGGNNLRVVYGNGRHIVFDAGDGFLTTDNGESWQTVAGRPQIVFGNGVFLSGSEVSVDGENWTPVSILADEFETIRDIGFDGSVFLVTSNMDRAYTSADGFTWQQVSTDAPGNVATLVGHQGEWLALKTGGSYERSLDGGATWTAHVISNATLNDAAYGNGRWVIVTQNGRIRSSESAGGSFPEVGPVLTQGGALTSVKFIDGRFVVYRDNFSTYFVSETGLSGSWQEKTYAHATRMTAAAAGPDATLVTGFNNIVLRINAPSVGHPVITVQPPALLDVAEGGALGLNATAIGDPTLVYQWLLDGQPLANGGAVQGADSPGLTISPASEAAHAGIYRLIVRNTRGSAVSAAVEVRVVTLPVFTQQPAEVITPPGVEVVFTAATTGEGVTYQWFRNGVEIPGETSATLVIDNVSPANVGIHTVEATNAAGTVSSQPAALTLSATGDASLSLAHNTAFNANVPALQPTTVTFSGGSFPSFTLSQLLVQPDGKVLVAGQFDYSGIGGQTRRSLMRLNPDGTLDNTFDVPTLETDGFGGAKSAARIEQVALLSDGRIVLTGNSIQRIGGVLRTATKSAMLNADGTLVTTFSPSLASNASPFSVAVDGSDGILYAGANITSGRPIRRFETSGTLDSGFAGSSLGHAQTVGKSLLVQPDGRPVYTAYTSDFSSIRTYRATTAGAIDGTFQSADFGNTWVSSHTPLAGGEFLANGSFTAVNGTPRSGIARFAADGALDPAFAPQGELSGGNWVYSSALMPGGFVFAGGDFTTATASNLAVFGPGGALQEIPAFGTGTNILVNAVAANADGTIAYAAGNFTTLDGQAVPKVIRFDATAISGGDPLDLEIISVSNGRSFAAGDDLVLTVAATGGSLAFQWFKDNVLQPGETGMSLVLSNMSEANAGTYRVEVSDNTGMVPSGDIILTFEAPPAAGFADWPALADLPVDQRGPDATPAGDGVPNLVKYAIGVGPLESASGRLPQGVLESTVEDETYPTVCFTRDTAAAGVTLQVEVAADLDFAADLGTTVVSTEDLGNGLERVCVRSNARFSDHTRQFFRMRAGEE